MFDGAMLSEEARELLAVTISFVLVQPQDTNKNTLNEIKTLPQWRLLGHLLRQEGALMNMIVANMIRTLRTSQVMPEPQVIGHCPS